MKKVIDGLIHGAELSRSESRELMDKIIEVESPLQIASLLSILSFRGLRVSELLGFYDSLRSRSMSLDVGTREVIDLCGTGGDGKQTINISTLSAFVVAACGGRVVKHGNYGASSKSGSSNLLEGLGIKLTNDETLLRRQLETAGVCFLHAPLFHPALGKIAGLRKELGFRTVFNLLGPLLNPVNPSHQLIGVNSVSTAKLFAEFARLEERNISIVHSVDGYDEISLTGEFVILRRDGVEKKIPSDLGLEVVAAESLIGAADQKQVVVEAREILAGRGSKAHTSVVAINSAYALYELDRKSSIKELYLKAHECLISGAPLKTLETLLQLV